MSTLADTIKALLRKRNMALNTDLGQHFLIDETILGKIVDAAHITPEDTIVEIGPGLGVLTKELLERAGSVKIVELDGRWIPVLEEYIGAPAKQGGKLSITIGNALDVPLPTTPYKMVANIPYHITSPLLRHAFLQSPQTPTSMTLLIQREVAEKICDQHDRGILTVMVSFFGKASIVCKVPPSSFLPPPKVDSAVLQIDCFEKPLADKALIEKTLTLLKHGFSQKRKMLSNTIGRLDGGTETMAALAIDPKRRPQTLTTDEWLEVARRMP